MSSKLIPLKLGAIRVTASTILSGSLVVRQIGKASTPAKCLKKCLKRMPFSSITVRAASGPISPFYFYYLLYFGGSVSYRL